MNAGWVNGVQGNGVQGNGVQGNGVQGNGVQGNDDECETLTEASFLRYTKYYFPPTIALLWSQHNSMFFTRNTIILGSIVVVAFPPHAIK